MVCLLLRNALQTEDSFAVPATSTNSTLTDNHKRFQLIELQGTLEFERQSKNLTNTKCHVGQLSFSTDHIGRRIPVLTIGNHRLEGKIVRLKKPLALIRTIIAPEPIEGDEQTLQRSQPSSLAISTAATTPTKRLITADDSRTLLEHQTPFKTPKTPAYNRLMQTPAPNSSSPAYNMSQMTPGLPQSQLPAESAADYETRLASRQQLEIIAVIEEKYLFSERPEHHVPREDLPRKQQ
jgi:hypothetical protein